MPRLTALATADAPADSQPMLAAVQKKLGKVPNLVKTFAHSPAVLRFYLGQSDALAGGALPAPLREQIALAVAGSNACDYCASAHTVMGKGAGLDRDELAANLQGHSPDAKTQAALTLATGIVQTRGRVDSVYIDAARRAGYGDAEIVEIVANVAANIFTNYFNHVADTAIDFPIVRTTQAATA